MIKIVRTGLLTGALAVGGALVAVEPAQATTVCSSWRVVDSFRERVCTQHLSSSRIKHTITVQNLTSSTRTTQVTAFRYINGQVSICKSAVRNSFKPHQSRSWSCTSTRVKKYSYWTVGYVTKVGGGNVGVTSPKIKG